MENREELAWAAGFFDGEGCTCLTTERRMRTSRRLGLRISIVQKHREVLDRFMLAVGSGRLYGPYQHRTRYAVHAHGIEAEAILLKLWPWLDKIKRDQAIIALRAWKEQPPPSPRGSKPCDLDCTCGRHQEWSEERRDVQRTHMQGRWQEKKKILTGGGH